MGRSHTPRTTGVAKYLALVTVDSTYAHSTTLVSLLKPRRIYCMVSTRTDLYVMLATHRVHNVGGSMGRGEEGGGSLSTRE